GPRRGKRERDGPTGPTVREERPGVGVQDRVVRGLRDAGDQESPELALDRHVAFPFPSFRSMAAPDVPGDVRPSPSPNALTSPGLPSSGPAPPAVSLPSPRCT